MASTATQKRWLEKFPWDVVVEMNKQACKAGHTQHKTKADGYEKAFTLWEAIAGQEKTFREIVDACRQCHKYAPFRFFNGNTFAGIARVLSQEACPNVTPTKAFMFRAAVGHYVAGVISSEEFDDIYNRVMEGVDK